MAVIKFTNSKSSIKAIFEYITQPSKTEERYITGKDCVPEFALDEMTLVKNMHNKNNGRQYIHIVQSFDPKDELGYEDANAIGLLFAERFVGFQAIVATHTDRKHTHNHILLNSVNFETGYKFQQSQKDMQAVKDFSDELCRQFGLSIIENPSKYTGIPQGEYQSALKGESWKIELINTIDYAINISRSKEDFISNMNRFGYDVSWTDSRKNITYTTPDGKKCRDNKLHDSKYLKEAMEIGFGRTKENSIREAVSDTGGQIRTEIGHTVSGSKKDKSTADSASVNNGRTEKRSILDQLDNKKVEVRDKQNEKRPIEKFNHSHEL